MAANIGFGALVVAFLVSIYGIVAAAIGAWKKLPAWVESARLAMLLTFPLISLTALSIIYLLVTGSYEVAYVSEVTSNSMPLYLKVTALWGGQAGSLVFWSWLLSAFATAVTLRKWDRDREFLPWVIIVSLVTLAFFLLLIIFFENPFERLWQTAGGVKIAMFQPAGSLLFTQADGRGLNPLLRHPGMIIHPPMLYLGFVAFVIPYAFAIAALVTGRTDDRWIRITRRWSLVAWLFLSLGLILGGRWAYDVLGWGGYWGWDPVEIAAFMPWLSRNSVLAFRGDSREAGHVETLEHGPDYLNVLPGHFWDFFDAVRRALVCAFVCPKRHRAFIFWIYRNHVYHLTGAAPVSLGRT